MSRRSVRRAFSREFLLGHGEENPIDRGTGCGAGLDALIQPVDGFLIPARELLQQV
jgi:hypothetical protein